MPFTIQDILTLKDGRRRAWGFFLFLKREATVKLLPWHAKVQSLKL